MGRARAWYRFHFEADEALLGLGAVFACFQGVDYQAAVFCNGQLVGTHEGFFSPFECDITSAVRQGANELLVRVDNDAICNGNAAWGRPDLHGDKLYAATGLGWDEPGLGWHHCPPGMGIHRPVSIEARSRVHVHTLWVRPLPEEEAVEIHAEVWNTTSELQEVSIAYRIEPRNFRDGGAAATRDGDFGALNKAGPGLNYYRCRIPLREARPWSCNQPWLHQAAVALESGEGRDAQATVFGMRSFRLDTDAVPRGRLLLNGRPVLLRGANTMGHEQQCVLRGDMDQLLDDLLLVRLGNLNFLRITQRPVEREVYELCDALGILVQTDLPLFGYLRRNQFSEAIRQAVEMERLVRPHASVVITSFINEPFPDAWGDKSSRHLQRKGLEAFLRCASEATLVENPDRVIKPIDGDYQPPGPGLPDFHMYPGWYNGHGIDLGKLHAGYLPRIKQGWLAACGEFGAEGLESADLMRRRYPQAWLPGPDEDPAAWTPARIAQSQTWTHHGMFFDTQRSMEDWVEASQRHQAWVTRLMTRALRRDGRVVSFAIHLYIDAFPAGWMKTLIDCERRPKLAFWEYRDALAPILADLRLNRWHWTSGESIEAEAWICNDSSIHLPAARLVWCLEVGGTAQTACTAAATLRSHAPVCQGRIRLKVPTVTARTAARLHLALFDASGRCVNRTAEMLTLHPRPSRRAAVAEARCLGPAESTAAKLLRDLGAGDGHAVIACSDPALFSQRRFTLLKEVERGATLLLVELEPGTLDLPGGAVVIERCDMEQRIFVSRNTGHPLVSGFAPDDFRFWEDPELGRPAPVLKNLIHLPKDCDIWEPVLTTVQFGWGQKPVPAIACATRPYGRGRITLCQVKLAGRLCNPVAREFASRLLHRGSDVTSLVP